MNKIAKTRFKDRFFFVGLACLVFLSHHLYAEELSQNPSFFSLNDVVKKVLVHYPKLKAEVFNFKAMQASLGEARSRYMPRIGLDHTAINSNEPVFAFGSLLRQGSLESKHLAVNSLNDPDAISNYQSSGELTWPIFSGFQTEGYIRSARNEMKAAGALKDNIEQVAILEAVNGYLRILLLNRSLQLIDETIKDAAKAIKEADNLKDKGMVLGCDYLTAKALLSQFEQTKEKTVAFKRSAMMDLNILMGLEKETMISLQELTLPKQWPVMREEELVQDALTFRKDRQALQFQSDASKAQWRREANSWMPKVDAFARGESNTNQFGEEGSNYMYGVKVHMNIFEPRYDDRVRKFSAEASRSKTLVDDMDDAINRSVRQATYEYESYPAVLALGEQSLKDAAQAVIDISELYRSGRRTIADLLKAHAYALDLKLSYWNTRFQTLSSYVNLHFVSGRLSQGTVLGIEAMATEKTDP